VLKNFIFFTLSFSKANTQNKLKTVHKLFQRPFIEIVPRDQRKKRTKRSSLRCAKGSNENRCCRHELTVDFDKFGWDWIIGKIFFFESKNLTIIFNLQHLRSMMLTIVQENVK
jgi:hypothetical protein